MSDEGWPRFCIHCKHYGYEYARNEGIEYRLYPTCAVNGPLQPCSDYEREVGADDERGEHEQVQRVG